MKKHIKTFIPPSMRNLIRSIRSGNLSTVLEGEKYLSTFHKRFNKRSDVNGRQKTILFYPGFPSFGYVLYNAARVMGLKMTHNPKARYDVAIHWSDESVREQDADLSAVQEHCKVINLNCNNVTKNHISKVFESVFGYSLLVDPKKYKGVCLEKSDANARKDGHIVEAPLEKTKKGKIYQKLIDNQVDELSVEDIRVIIVGKSIPLVYIKQRPLNNRFKETLDAKIADVKDVLTNEEIENILKFCRQISMEYGELDVLRDRNDRRIYIVDANNTPHGPPQQMSWEKKEEALVRIAEAVYNEFLKDGS